MTEKMELNKPNTLDEGFDALDAVIAEVTACDEAIVSTILAKLGEENVVLRNTVIADVCTVLSKFNLTPSVDLLRETIALLWDRNVRVISDVFVVDACIVRILNAENPYEQ